MTLTAISATVTTGAVREGMVSRIGIKRRSITCFGGARATRTRFDHDFDRVRDLDCLDRDYDLNLDRDFDHDRDYVFVAGKGCEMRSSRMRP
jgi:hypothetical protein